MPRKPRLDLDLSHPTVDANRIEVRRIYGANKAAAPVVCPDCKLERWWSLATLRTQLSRPNFTGHCRPCAIEARRAGNHRVLMAAGAPPRLTKNGYVLISAGAVSREDLPFFRAMQRSGQAVLEHRLSMAKKIGRPLRSDEMVDHMDGVKTNNAPENLRLYVRGKQQPGSCPGHGTYYDEWQAALARIRELEALLAGSQTESGVQTLAA